jgi:hypothetical protein
MLKYVKDWDMLKRYVFGLFILIIVLGAVFLSLDVLDIDEAYNLPLPVNVFNTIFIAAPALLLVYLATRRFAITGLPELLVLGGAQFIMGVGSFLKGWLPFQNLDIPITLHESMALMASLVFLAGGIQVTARTKNLEYDPRQKRNVIIIFYLGILFVISLVIWLVFQGIIPSFAAPVAGAFSTQSLMQEIASLVLFISTFLYCKIYSRSHTALYYWYYCGLLLLAIGVLFISLGHVESRIAWLGRFSEYTGNMCFIFAMISANNRSIDDKLKKSYFYS